MKGKTHAAIPNTPSPRGRWRDDRGVARNGGDRCSRDCPAPAADPLVGCRSLELDSGAAEWDIHLEDGSAALEGVAAIAIVFILFVVLTQVAAAFLAHRTAEVAVVAAVNRLALEQDPSATQLRLANDLATVLPGSRVVAVETGIGSSEARAVARFVFSPPGPFLSSILMEVKAVAALVVRP